MTEGAMFWFIVGGISGAVFFGIALVVSIRGIGELRELMSRTARREKKSP
jgi:hypothetical protein